MVHDVDSSWSVMTICHDESWWFIPMNHYDSLWWFIIAKLIMIQHDKSALCITMMHYDGSAWWIIMIHPDESSGWGTMRIDHDEAWRCIMMVRHDVPWWFITMNHDDSSRQLIVTQPCESLCSPERIHFMAAMALKRFLSGLPCFFVAMGTMNTCDASIHGAHAIVPRQDPQNGKCSSPGETTKNS